MTPLMTYDAANFTFQKAFELGKMSSAPKLHKEVCTWLREEFRFGVQRACTVSRQIVASSYDA